MTAVLPPADKISKLPAEKRDDILRAALEAFAERGVSGVTVPAIAARAGVATGTIYRFFESKEELVNELYRREKRELGKRLSVGLEVRLPPYELFVEVWRRLVSYAREQPHAYRFLELQDHLLVLDQTSREAGRKVLTPILHGFRRQQEEGVVRSDLRAEVMMALVWGAFVNLFKAERDGHFVLRPEDIDAACEACWRMCRADTGSVTT